MWFFKPSQTDSTNRKIFRATVAIGVLSLVAKVGSTAKELIVAKSFGRSDALDAFLIAFLLPSFIVNLIMGGLGLALVPTLVEVRQNQGVQAAQKLFSSIMILCTLLLLAVIILLGLLAPYYLPVMGSSFAPAKLLLTRKLLYFLLPFILFSGIAACLSAVLNAGETFALPAVVPLITPLLTIVLIELFVNRWGAFVLAAGLLAGSILEAVLLGRALKRNGLAFKLRWHGLDPAARTVLRQYLPMVAASFLMGGTALVDQSMAAMLPAGSVAALNYGNRVVGLFLALGGSALAAAVLPYFSKMAAQSDWNGCRHTLKRYCALVLITTVPLTLCLMVFSRPLVRLLFERGAFNSADTNLVSWVQFCYAVQLPFNVLGILFVRFVSAIRRSEVLLYLAVVNLVLDVVLNLAFMKIWGVAGIALSTSLVYVVSFVWLTLFSTRTLARAPVTMPPAMQSENAAL